MLLTLVGILPSVNLIKVISRVCAVIAIWFIFNISAVSAQSVYGIILSIEVKLKPVDQMMESSDDMDDLIAGLLIEKDGVDPGYKPQKTENTDIIDVISSEVAEDGVLTTVDIVQKPKTVSNNENLDVLITNIDNRDKVKKPVIIIDAGHGGKDSGTIGYGRVKEKDVVLLYTKELVARLKRTKKYKVHFTRSKDIFLPLRRRTSIARKLNADLFISIHADAALNKKARGLSIYTLSEKASGKEAALLARKENREDVIAGIDLSNLEKDVSDTLIDLSLREAKNKSRIFARILHKNLKNKVRVRKNALHSAGFVVLKNPNMASILLEIGFLSNKYDTKNLRKKSYRRTLISGILYSIDKYFEDEY